MQRPLLLQVSFLLQNVWQLSATMPVGHSMQFPPTLSSVQTHEPSPSHLPFISHVVFEWQKLEHMDPLALPMHTSHTAPPKGSSHRQLASRPTQLPWLLQFTCAKQMSSHCSPISGDRHVSQTSPPNPSKHSQIGPNVRFTTGMIPSGSPGSINCTRHLPRLWHVESHLHSLEHDSSPIAPWEQN